MVDTTADQVFDDFHAFIVAADLMVPFSHGPEDAADLALQTVLDDNTPSEADVNDDALPEKHPWAELSATEQRRVLEQLNELLEEDTGEELPVLETVINDDHTDEQVDDLFRTGLKQGLLLLNPEAETPTA